MSCYLPIDCNLHDRLEALATLRKRCRIVYRTPAGKVVEAFDTLSDLYTKNKEEFAVLGSGTVIRLDALLEVDGHTYSTEDRTS